MNGINKTSNFWLGDDIQDRFYNPLTGQNEAPSGRDLMAMASYQNAIGNFVSILTNENIPVKFAGKDSYTDGKTVVLAANINSGNFDIAVGLALHEGSHIKLTDFTHLQNGLDNYIPSTLYTAAEKKNIKRAQLTDIVKSLLNVVEDRRIDKYVQTEAPGYRGYYEAMYDKYFNAAIIDKALKTNQWGEPTIENYMSHIINFINVNRTLDALPGLRDIWNILDLRNIDRLKSTDDALQVSLEIATKLIDVVPKVQDEDNKPPESGNKGESGDGNGQGGSNDDSDNNDMDGNDDGEGSEGEDSNDTSDGDEEGDSQGTQPTADLTEKQKKQLKNALEKQKDFTEGNVKKPTLKKSEEKLLDAIRESDTSVENVESNSTYGGGTKNTKVVVIRKINEATKDLCTMFRTGTSCTSEEGVTKGLQLGAMLGKKLRVRNDDVTIQYNRQRKGKVDRRLLAEFGVGNSKIFEQSFTTKASDAGIHISIDASGSMSGDYWQKAITTAVAIAKAADLVGGIRVRIDIRSICSSSGLHGKGGNMYGSNYGATVLVAYDSKVDKLLHIRKYFPYLHATGGTPEGLCFEAIMDIIQQGGKDTDRYFINFSDGEPSGNYVDLTRKAVNKMRQSGMKVLSYFIGMSTHRNTTFDTMYGKDAAYVDTNSIVQVAKTMNKLLSERG